MDFGITTASHGLRASKSLILQLSAVPSPRLWGFFLAFLGAWKDEFIPTNTKGLKPDKSELPPPPENQPGTCRWELPPVSSDLLMMQENRLVDFV